MEAQMSDNTEIRSENQPQQTNRVAPSPVGSKVVGSSQPLLALSSLGLAYGSLKSVMKRIKRATTFGNFKLPKVVRTIPRYMKSNYVKYPVLLIVLLAATRRVRAAINH